jgi:AraC family transcriptional regulator
LTSEEHIKRIRKVLNFIEENLDNELSLENLAEIGNYSPFHFHRIFRGIIGETLQEYITRNRMEKSAMLLSHQKQKSLEDIFSSWFQKQFYFQQNFQEIFRCFAFCF